MPVDPEFAAELARDLSQEDFVRVLSLFRQDVEQLTQAIGAAAAAADPQGLRRSAHGLAGAAGAVGAKDLEAACRTVMSPHYVFADFSSIAQRIATLADATLADISAALVRIGKP